MDETHAHYPIDCSFGILAWNIKKYSTLDYTLCVENRQPPSKKETENFQPVLHFAPRKTALHFPRRRLTAALYKTGQTEYTMLWKRWKNFQHSCGKPRFPVFGKTTRSCCFRPVLTRLFNTSYTPTGFSTAFPGFYPVQTADFNTFNGVFNNCDGLEIYTGSNAPPVPSRAAFL